MRRTFFILARARAYIILYYVRRAQYRFYIFLFSLSFSFRFVFVSFHSPAAAAAAATRVSCGTNVSEEAARTCAGQIPRLGLVCASHAGVALQRRGSDSQKKIYHSQRREMSSAIFFFFFF